MPKDKKSESPTKGSDDGERRFHEHMLANVSPKAERRQLNETRQRAKRTYGFSDSDLDRVYGVGSRYK